MVYCAMASRRAAAFVGGGFVPPAARGTVSDGMIAIADWYGTLAALAGVDPTDHAAAASGLPPIDSVDVWPLVIGANKTSPRCVALRCRFSQSLVVSDAPLPKS